MADVVPITKSFFKERERIKQTKLLNKVSGIIPITDLIKDDLAPQQRSLRIEGGIIDIPKYCDLTDIDPIIITYTGSLDDNSNIEVLIDAFKQIKVNNIKLVIAGSGKYIGVFKKAAADDTRIIYYGHINNHDCVNLQNQSHILVCPRIPNGYVTRYTFPSKLFEYLLTGHCVVTFHLEGIPKEYDTFLYYPSACNSNALAETIINVIDKRCFFNVEQVCFMNSKKWTEQADKVVKFIRER